MTECNEFKWRHSTKCSQTAGIVEAMGSMLTFDAEKNPFLKKFKSKENCDNKIVVLIH